MLNHPALTLSDSGIEHKDGKIFTQKRTFGWTDVEAIRIVGDEMRLKLADGDETGLSLPGLLYEERKKIRERLAEIAVEKGVSFSSAF